jgi:hypothetical protein
VSRKQARIGWVVVILLSIISLVIGTILLVRASEFGYWSAGPGPIVFYESLIKGLVSGFAIPIALIGGFAFWRAGA